MEILIQLLVVLAIVGIVWWAVQSIPMPPPFRIAAVVIVAVVAIYFLVKMLGVKL